MSDQGEKMCPLCAEEMDLTDQQLKPCKCGYEICVWCWHHIMDMAEKDDTEGRCPACRVPYDKEKIVGMAANCERLVAENSMEKKVKSQKTKTKMAEERKQLGSVRVIRRNLVYIVGLPLNLADEDLLQRKEYFGQYGRVLKVSISRTAAGSIQHFPNNTCSVYITYSKEDEAIRCIQSVHEFTLDGRSLRACFGTTKYCHAWLRSVPCNNPDCLYLHEIGLQEDSFTKDEIISAYTRSRVQQITGSTSNLQRSSGNVLPPPIDDYHIKSFASMGKPNSKNASNNGASIIKGSPSNGASVKSVSLPAAASWGMRASNHHTPASTSACSNGLSKQKPDTLSGSLPSSLSPSSTMHTYKSQSEMGKRILLNQESQTKQIKSKVGTFESDKAYDDIDFQTTASDAVVSSTVSSSSVPTLTDANRSSNLPSNISFECNTNSSGSDSEKSVDVTTNAKINNLGSVLSSMSINKEPMNGQTGVIKPNFPLHDLVLMKSLRTGNSELQQYYGEQLRESLNSSADKKAESSFNAVGVCREQCTLRFDLQSLEDKCSEVQNDMPYFNKQKSSDSEDISNTTLHGAARLLNGSRDYSSQSSSFNARPLIVDTKSNGNLTAIASDVFPISCRYPEKHAGPTKTAGLAHLLSNEGRVEKMRRFDCVDAIGRSAAGVDMGESSIISNILSMDFDAWDDSLTSPQDLAKLLSDSDQQQGSHKMSSSWKVQNSNQSRFSFARQEESKNNLPDLQPSFNSIGRVPDIQPSFNSFDGVPNIQSLNQNLVGDGYPHFDKCGDASVFSSARIQESNNFLTSHSVLSSSKLSVSRDQVSAPPGFSVPSRAPPPGFVSHEKMDQGFDIPTGSRLLDSSLLRNPYQAPETDNVSSTGDVEFIDPAILAVGKGRLPGGLNSAGLEMRSNVSPQFSTFENEARLQLLKQRSLALQQNTRYSGIGAQFSSINDSFGIPSRHMEQQLQASTLSPFSQISGQQSRSSLMSNGHLDGWNEVHNGNNLAVAELLRNERLGFNKFCTGLEDPKFRMPNSSDLYNRTFGM